MSSCSLDTEQVKLDKVYEVHRGEAEKPDNNRNYSDAYYRNAFRVLGGPIRLHSVGFFGPANSDNAQYEITVFVERPSFDLKFPWYYHFLPCLAPYFYNPDLNAEVFGSFNGTGLAKKDEIMYVSFKEPIDIPEGAWIGITFKLQGEPTARMRLGKLIDAIEVQTEHGIRKFHFLSGSCQMPAIRFQA